MHFLNLGPKTRQNGHFRVKLVKTREKRPFPKSRVAAQSNFVTFGPGTEYGHGHVHEALCVQSKRSPVKEPRLPQTRDDRTAGTWGGWVAMGWGCRVVGSGGGHVVGGVPVRVGRGYGCIWQY